MKFMYVIFVSLIVVSCNEPADVRTSKDSEVVVKQEVLPGYRELDESLPSFFEPVAQLQEPPASNRYHADFNGDGKKDTLYIVSTRGRADQLPKNITLVRPWSVNDDVVDENNLSTGARNNMAVVHADSNNYFLIFDANPISILDTQAAQELSVVAKENLHDLEEPALAEEAKGDVLIIPTEAGIDNYLYWDGETYRSFEGEDIP